MPNVVKIQAGYKVQPLSAVSEAARAAGGAGRSTSPRSTRRWSRPTSSTTSTSRCSSRPPGRKRRRSARSCAGIGVEAGKNVRLQGPLAGAHKRKSVLGMKDGEEKVEQYLEPGHEEHQRLEDRLALRRPRVLQRRLAEARRRRQGRHLRQRRGRSHVSHDQDDGGWRAARRQQAQLHAHLRRRAVAAGQRVLVGDDVRRQDAAADQEPDQPLPDQLADAAAA